MAERSTVTVTSPSNHAYVLNAYMTGREANELADIVKRKMSMSTDDIAGGRIAIEKISGEILIDQERLVLAYMLVSVDGITENPVEALLDMPVAELDFVRAEVEKLTKNPSEPKK